MLSGHVGAPDRTVAPVVYPRRIAASFAKASWLNTSPLFRIDNRYQPVLLLIIWKGATVTVHGLRVTKEQYQFAKTSAIYVCE